MAPTADKLLSREAALAWRRGSPGTLVFTNGVFDLLHPGHVEYLEAARALGSHLLVAVNSDRSARALPEGRRRPRGRERRAARGRPGRGAVDAVVMFDAPTPLDLISTLAPDLLVKGGDYAREAIVG